MNTYKKNLFIVPFCLICYFAIGQTNDKYIDKVKTIDSTIETLYSVISGDKGEVRNWELFKYLFKEEAKLIPTKKDENTYTAMYLTPDEYINRSGKWLIENGFHEKEIYRVTEQFGNIVHLFSTYESYRKKTDKKPFMRGINSIQLLYDNERWWIVNIYWMGETKDTPIPTKYLPKS